MDKEIEIPKQLSREYLIGEFGNNAVTYYEDRIKNRQENEGKKYFNLLKTVYLWAYKDRQSCEGFYKKAVPSFRNRKAKNHGGS